MNEINYKNSINIQNKINGEKRNNNFLTYNACINPSQLLLELVSPFGLRIFAI
jgi:hypothetical protein